MRRYKHNLSHFRNTTCDMGQLTPIACLEVVRGDTFKHNSSAFLRVSPLAYPIMHPVHTHIHHVFVPNRLIWPEFEDFITGGEDMTDATVHPTIDFSASPVTAGSLANHLGLPVGYAGLANALPFRAYNFIYNKIYRDQQIQDELALSDGSGADAITSTELVNVNWAKDYFTGAKIDDELGSDVSIPLSGEAAVTGIGQEGQVYQNGSKNSYETDGISASSYGKYQTSSTGVGNRLLWEEDPNNAGYPNIRATLSSGASMEMEDLMLALATEKLQDAANRYGNDYNDFLRRHQIRPSDGRLAEPEYLGGGKQTVQFSEVVATAEGANTNVGDLSGHGIAALRSNSYLKYFEEDGFVISLMYVRPIPMYMQGVSKMWLKDSRYDYYQKEFEDLGMQPILNKEIKHDHADPAGIFGYAPVYNDLKRIPNTVHAEFTTNPLQDMHMANIYATDPALNSDFLTCNPTERIYHDSGIANLQCTIQNKIAARRFLPNKSKPPSLA